MSRQSFRFRSRESRLRVIRMRAAKYSSQAEILLLPRCHRLVVARSESARCGRRHMSPDVSYYMSLKVVTTSNLLFVLLWSCYVV